jgi:hypothetical protein
VDPDLTFHPDVDPDPAYHFDADSDADPDPDFYLMQIRMRICIHNTASYYLTTRMLHKLFVKYLKNANTFLEVL